MFCPKCKVEYEDWVKECAECGVLLIENIPVEPHIQLVEIFRSTSIQEMDFVKSMLETEGLEVFSEGYTSSFVGLGGPTEITLFVLEKECVKGSEVIKDYIASQKPVDYTLYKPSEKKTCTFGEKNFYLAGRISRLGATCIDDSLNSVFWSFIVLKYYSLPSAFLGIIAGILILLLQVLFLSADGQSLGKKALKIRIVKAGTGENGGFLNNVLLRIILNGFLSILPIYRLIDVLFIFREDRRCIHDFIAGTCVVETGA